MDKRALEAWFRSLPDRTEANCFAVTIANRCAMRVLPLMVHVRNPRIVLAVVRASLISGVASVGTPGEFREVAADAAAFADAAAAAAGADAAPFAAADAATFAADAATFAADADAAPFAADAAARAAAHVDTVWDAVGSDLAALSEGRGLEQTPLWPQRNPLADHWKRFRDALSTEGDTWAFWLSWYDKALAGQPQDWKLLTEIALIPSEDWDKGPEHIAALIADLQFKHAVAATPNAEVVSVNEATGKLRVDPVSEMPGDHLADALDKLRDVVALFDPAADLSNQHRAVGPETDIIAQAVEKYAGRPRMLHSACVRVIRRLDVKIRNGECPSREQDADIADFYGTVLAVSVDLYERDPLVREAVDHTASVRLRDVKPDEAETLVKAADEVAAVSEGDLAAELPEQARAAVDPATPQPERKEALYVTVSRLLRVSARTWTDVTVTAQAVITTWHWLNHAITIILRLF